MTDAGRQRGYCGGRLKGSRSERVVGIHHSQTATAVHTAAGTKPYDAGRYHHDRAELSVIVTVLSHFARSGIERDSRQLRTIGPITGCASSQCSQRLLPRAKQ